MLRRLLGNTKRRLRLTQSLGAFTRPDHGDISPLYVFFDVTNAGRESVKIACAHVSPKEDSPAHSEPLEGEQSLPVTLEPGGNVRFWLRAKPLARNLEEAGHAGTPRLRFVVEDADANVYDKRFTFRAGEYLQLKDE